MDIGNLPPVIAKDRIIALGVLTVYITIRILCCTIVCLIDMCFIRCYNRY